MAFTACNLKNMINAQSIITEIRGPLARLWLNRPGVRNALDKQMLEELFSTLEDINNNPAIRIVSLRGMGSSFCAGADLGWMQKAHDLSGEENYRESTLLAQCFHALYTSPKIIVAGIHGAALGGAIGLVSASDMAVTTNTTVFAFSEVKLGLIPATVAPYLLRKSSSGKIMEYLLTGRKFSGHDAVSIGLVNRSVPDEQFEQVHEDLLNELMKAAPVAQLKIKELIRSLTGSAPDITTMARTASLLAEARVSEEAREGIRAFLEKRQPGWMTSQ
jgi:methylglutaconyl-CoA hydratase